MASMNLVVIMGHLTADPEVKVLESGTSVANATVAINERFTDREGNQQESVHFVAIEAWGRQAEIMNEYLAKGSPLAIEGSLKYEQWTDAETESTRSRLKVRVRRFQFLNPSPNGNGNGNQESDTNEINF